MRRILFWSLSFFGALAPWFEAFRAMAELDPSPWEDAGPADGEQPTVTEGPEGPEGEAGEATKMALGFPDRREERNRCGLSLRLASTFGDFLWRIYRECHRVIGI